MVFSFFTAYMLIGLCISALVFFWALKNGQFSDQKRAAFLPLQHDTEGTPSRIGRIHRLEGLALMAVACVGLLISAFVLAFSLLQAR
ncbi:MAG: cbb3-type cytochrome oxidase assembly protein CcoS [Pseudomonadota bacterium]